MLNKNVKTYILILLLSIITFNQYFKENNYIILVMNLLFAIMIFGMFYIDKDHTENRISKGIISHRHKSKNPDSHYVIFLEITNLSVYSQFYDLSLSDKILEDIYNILRKVINTNNIFKYSDNQLVIIEEFEQPEINNYQSRYNEQLLMAKKLMNYIKNNPIFLDTSKNNVKVSLSAGVSSMGIKKEIDTIEELVRLAHFTLLEAKKKNMEILVADEHVKSTKKDLDDFTHAIEKSFLLDEFNPYYQPIVDTNSLKLVGIESLVRWQKDTYRIIEAAKFKDIAIEKKLFTKIDIRIIKKTLNTYKLLKEKDLIDDGFFVVINISHDTLHTLDITRLIDLVNDYKVNTECIEFDIQISGQIDPKTKQKINKLINQGFKISLDNVSISNFNIDAIINLKLNTIKFNTQFFSSIAHSEHSETLQSVIKEFTKIYNIKTLLKGIENKKELNYARKFQVNYAQGYYFTSPLTEIKTIEFFKKYRNGIQ
ncbi:MAG: EAL domain-containing protein [Candidatus Izemoplasma sp.]